MTGDAAVTVSFPARIDPALGARVVALADTIRAAGYQGVRDVVPCYHAVTVYLDPIRTDLDRLWTALEQGASAEVDPIRSPRELVVPVTYGGEAGPDLPEVARFAGVSPEEVVRLHTGRRYQVYMVGFLAGFPYMGAVDARIAIPRRATPRLRVPAGSVGIAGEQTGIYPTAAPGGWHLIGQTLVEPFDPRREPPCLYRPGDLVVFESVSAGGGPA